MRVEHFVDNKEFARMRYIDRTSGIPIPTWALDNEKVRRVVLFYLCQQARCLSHVPDDLESAREIERLVMERWQARSDDNAKKFVEVVSAHGGPLAFMTALVYKRYRLRTDSFSLADEFGMTPDMVRIRLYRLNTTAMYLFGADAGVKSQPRRTKFKLATAAARERVLEMRHAGLSFRAIGRMLNCDRGVVQRLAVEASC